MEIKLVKIQFQKGCHSYKYHPFDYCCEELKHSPCICFTSEDIETFDIDDGLNSDFPRFCIERKDIVIDREETWDLNLNFPIKYCPYCGERIKIKLTGTKHAEAAYASLTKRRETIWNQCRTTDSKRKENELKNEVHLLDQKINCFWTLGPIGEFKKE